MRSTATPLAFLLTLPLTLALPHPSYRYESRSVSPATSSGLSTAPYSVAITTKVARSAGRQQRLRDYMASLSTASSSSSYNTSNDTVVLSAPAGASEYAIPIIIGGQNFTVILDTGSSDLWIPAPNFTCVDLDTGADVSQSECDFGGNYYNVSASATYQSFPVAANFNITYGDGEYATGTPGYDTLTVGNLTVPHQLFSVVSLAAWEGDNVTDGLLGLASPYLTSVYNGSNPADDDYETNEYIYNPFFYSAVADNLTAPYFSIALNRPTLEQEEYSYADYQAFGYFAIGGLPSQVNVTNKTVTVPDLSYTFEVDGTNETQPLYYTIEIDEITFPGSTEISGGTSNNLTILDSGTTLVYLQSDVAEAINAAFDPAAEYDEEQELYFVSCTATPPALSVTIGGTEFSFNSTDLIYFDETVGSNEYCISSIQDGGSAGSVFILGDRFLVNVVYTPNIVTKNITITERLY